MATLKKWNFSLILWGWVALWLIHIGVRKYLEEHDLIPAEIVGTSMGAIVWAGIATGKTADEMESYAKKFAQEKIKFLDIYFKNGLFKGKRFLTYFQNVFASQNIENTDISLKVVSTALDKWELFVFEKWKIADALRASMSIPWVIEPFNYNKTMLVDGGVLSNLPIELAQKKKILAVSVIQSDVNIQIKDSNRYIPLKRAFLWFNYSILQKSLHLLLLQNEEKSKNLNKKKDLFILDSKHNYNFLDFGKYKEMINFGYKEMAKLHKGI